MERYPDSQPIIAPQDFRRALGHYPTGVTVVAAAPEDGSPVAVVVGTFTSVSLDPPLVGFLIDRTSRSWPSIRETGRFCVSVLSASQEHICRAFATKAPHRFRYLSPLPSSGQPRLTGASLWVDCTIDQVMPAGDHEFVLGRVHEFGVADEPSRPLLFLRGGYGAPHIASLQAEQPGLAPQLRQADLVRPEIESVARDLDLECMVTAVVDGEIVILASAGLASGGGSDTHVGSVFPHAAPFGPLFVAWASEEAQDRWIAAGSRIAADDLSEIALSELAAVRERGYVVITGKTATRRFDQYALSGAPPTPERNEELKAVVRTLSRRGLDPGLRTPLDEVADVTSLHVPVRDSAGAVQLSLVLIGFSGHETPDRVRRCRDRLIAGAERASVLLSG